MFKNYLKVAVRNLVVNKLFSLINISGLAVAMACGILILLYVKDELSFDGFHKNAGRIYQLVCDRIEKDGSDEKFAIAAMVQGPAFQRAIPEIEQFVRVCPSQATVKIQNAGFIEDITWADKSFFTFFTFPLVSGNLRSALNDPHAVAISEETAKKYFNSTDVLGKILQIEINGKPEPFRISAVAKQAPENSSIKFNLVLPFEYLEKVNPDNGWMWVSYPTYFLLRPGSNLNAVTAKMREVYETQAHEEIDMNHEAGYDNKFTWSLLPFEQMHLNTVYKGSFEASDPLYYRILVTIAFFIVLIAGTNFINLTIAGSLRRYREIGVRKAIGSLRSQLAVQFFSESLLTSFLAFLLAIFLAWVSLPVFNKLANKTINFGYHFDTMLIAVLFLFFVLTGFLAGFYPALVLSSVKPVQALNGNLKSAGKKGLMKAFVVAQFCLAAFFMIIVTMMNVQFHFLKNADLGYNEKNLIEFNVEKATMNKGMMNLLVSAFACVRGVQSVGFCNIGRFGGKTIANQRQIEALYQRIDEGYLNTIQAHLLAGRNFSKEFSSDSTDAVMVNEAFVREAKWSNAVGKDIDFMNIPGWDNKKIAVIGVVKDYHAESLKEQIKPMVFTMDNRLPMGRFVLRLAANNTTQTLTRLEKKYQALLPNHPLQYAFKEESNSVAYSRDDRWKAIISFGAGIVIFISCIGLFGISILVIKNRSKEIAVRKVLGASNAGLLALLSGDFIKLVLLGFVIASPLAYFTVKKWLENFAYRADLSWQIFFSSGMAIVFIALAATGFQSVKAALANPAISLKQD